MTTNVDNSRTRIVVFGATGRMGVRIAALAREDARFDVRGLVARTAHGSTDGGLALHTPESAEKTGISADVVIDFSSDEGAALALGLARRWNAALLVGTTALSPATLAELRSASAAVAVMVAPNTSLGVAALSVLVRQACRTLGPEYQISIVEHHHAAKKDAPSGTALRLARAAREAGHEVRDDQVVAGRAGDVIGEHTVRLAGPGEYLELTHRATTRDLFARGALRCALWLKGRTPGWYSVEDSLGLSA